MCLHVYFIINKYVDDLVLIFIIIFFSSCQFLSMRLCLAPMAEPARAKLSQSHFHTFHYCQSRSPLCLLSVPAVNNIFEVCSTGTVYTDTRLNENFPIV